MLKIELVLCKHPRVFLPHPTGCGCLMWMFQDFRTPNFNGEDQKCMKIQLTHSTSARSGSFKLHHNPFNTVPTSSDILLCKDLSLMKYPSINHSIRPQEIRLQIFIKNDDPVCEKGSYSLSRLLALTNHNFWWVHPITFISHHVI